MSERERERSRERMTLETKPEEVDTMERGRKKVRNNDEKFTNSQSLAPRVEDWMTENTTGEETITPEVAKRSYKDACVEDQSLKYVSDEDEEWWRGDGWKSRIEVEMTQKGPNIIVSPEFKQKLARKWKTSLIVRLLGRMVREDQLSRKLQQLWGRRGEVETIEISSGYFLVRMSNEEDYDFALTGGPWLYMDHYLAVQP